MCGGEQREREGLSASSYWRNLRQPMPLGAKLKLLARNASRRFFPRPATCCDRPGEPGC